MRDWHDPRRRFESIDDITLEHANGVRHVLARKVVMNRNGWAIIVFAYQDRRPNRWTDTRYVISKWRRLACRWRHYSHVVIQPGEHTRGVMLALLELEEQLCPDARR